jgi:hypothetical protein
MKSLQQQTRMTILKHINVKNFQAPSHVREGVGKPVLLLFYCSVQPFSTVTLALRTENHFLVLAGGREEMPRNGPWIILSQISPN